MYVLLILFFAVLFIQLIYLFCFLGALIKKSKPLQSDNQPVSVVVCAHDEEENLRELIPVLLAQDHPQFEVIVVNDRSNDDTYEFLRLESLHDPRLRMVNVDHLPPHADGKKYGITLAIKAAKHDIILLTDADCRPQTSTWITSMCSGFSSETKFVLGYSPYRKENGFLNLFIRYETLYTAMQYISFALMGNPYMGVGRNLAYRKSLFLEVKGFKDILSVTGGDDDLFVNKHGIGNNVAISVGSDSLVLSTPKKTLGNFFDQKVRHLSVGKKYKTSHKLVLGLFSLSFLLTWISGFVLIFSSIELIWVISALIFRSLVLTVAIYVASKRFGHKFEGWATPGLDFIFLIYYLSTGSVALFTNRVKWKT